MTVFKVGDKVQQSEASNYRWRTPTNPVGVTGVVVEVRTSYGNFKYRVEWPGGNFNSYEESDLELVEAPTDVLVHAKRLQELRVQQSNLTSEITEIAEKIRKALEGTGLMLIEDVKEQAKTVTLLALEVAGDVEIGQQFMCNVSDHPSEHVVGKIYEVIDLDRGDSMPVKLQSEDGYGWWLDLRFLQNYTLVS